jgi:hypothetical protein
MAQERDLCCKEVIEAITAIDDIKRRQDSMEDTQGRIFGKIESNNRWIVGLFLTSVGLFIEIATVIYMVSGKHP